MWFRTPLPEGWAEVGVEGETDGVEALLESLEEPVKVVFAVPLDDVKQHVSLWSEAMKKEVQARLDAGALVSVQLAIFNSNAPTVAT